MPSPIFTPPEQSFTSPSAKPADSFSCTDYFHSQEREIHVQNHFVRLVQFVFHSQLGELVQMSTKIAKVHARQAIASRRNPTLHADHILQPPPLLPPPSP